MELKVVNPGRMFFIISSFFFLRLINCLSPFRDMRYVSYEDIHMSSDTQMFHHPSISSFAHPIFHSPHRQIIIAAKNHLLRLHTADLSAIEISEWKPEQHHRISCENKGIPPEDCENYIKLLVLHNDDVIACGTHAHSPLCSWRNVTALSETFRSETGLGRSPYKRHSNNSFLITSSGDLYTALTLDASSLDSAIVRTIGPSVPLRTDKSNSFWLDKPEFVGMFEYGAHVFVFFREVAVEQISCGKLIVSRVARICKSDRGGTSWILKNNWITFVKASLNCSRPGEYPFYYNEIQDVHFDERRKIFTAVFTTPSNSLYGSAVCEYSVDAIGHAMKGNFKEYHAEQRTWKSKSSEHGKECPKTGSGESDKDTNLSHLHIITASQHQLADSTVQPLQIHPIIERPNERYNKIEVEVTQGKYRNKSCELKLIYMATFEGLVNKFVIVPNNHTIKHLRKRNNHHRHLRHHTHHLLRKKEKTACFLESIQLFPLDLPGSIKFIKINPSTKRLVIGTESRIYQIPRFRCQKFRIKTACEAAQDPHCQWIDSLCQSTPTPSISSCPITNLIGKTWYGWSDWSECSVTCGEGIQMRMLLCLDDINRLAYSNDLKHSLKCSGSNYVTRSCKMKQCADHITSSWSSWLVNENKEERFRCLCKGGCQALLQRSERMCKNEERCGTRLKRLVGRGIKRDHSRSNQRYNQFSNLAYNSRHPIRKRPTINSSYNRTVSLKKDNVLVTNNLKNAYSVNYAKRNKSQFSKHLTRTTISSQALSASKLTNSTTNKPCPDTCMHQIPPQMGIFYGYCGCRDMGLFRVCHKCSGNS